MSEVNHGQVIVAENSGKYHNIKEVKENGKWKFQSDCGYIITSCSVMSPQKAKKRGYQACTKCFSKEELHRCVKEPDDFLPDYAVTWVVEEAVNRAGDHQMFLRVKNEERNRGIQIEHCPFCGYEIEDSVETSTTEGESQ